MAPRPPRRVLPLLLVAYAATYLCRANVEPALNVGADEYGYDNEQLGLVLGVALGLYAAGKLVFGPLADLLGGKAILVAAMLGSCLCSYLIAVVDPPRRFGVGAGLIVLGAFIGANRFVQAGGWGGLVHVVGAVYEPSKRGTVMGILSTSYDVGNVFALFLSAALIEAGLGWKALFLVNPSLVFVVALGVQALLPRGPRHKQQEVEEAEPVGAIYKRLIREPAFWFGTALSFVLTFARSSFMTWTPRFLYEVSVAAHAKSPMGSSVAKSAFFGCAGMVGSIVVGRLSDRMGPGKRAPVMIGSLAMLLLCILALAHAGVTSPWSASILIALCGLFLLGPYSLLAGAVSLDVAGARGAATAAGVIDAVGYAGASLAAIAVGSVSKRAGWTAAFDLVAGVVLVSLVLASVWARRSRS